tara:strand:+ start:298 stop:666 length:369 start_codon:yes stop_codon:yes gene_type:complete
MKTQPLTQKTKEQNIDAFGQKHSGDLDSLIDAMLKGASEMTGYSPDQLKKLKKNYIIRWRNIIIYTLVSEFGCNLEEVCDAFGQDKVLVGVALDDLEGIRATEGRRHLLLPYVNRLVDYIVL